MTDQHKFHMRLPRSVREIPLFIIIVSLLSVNIIPVIIASLHDGFSIETWTRVLTMLPILWPVIMIVVVATNRPATVLVKKILQPTDSFNAHIIVELLINVFLMSVIMTIVGAWIAGGVSWQPVVHFFENWPRNFAIAFAVEMLIAHPIAHYLMHHYHLRRDGVVISRIIKAQR